MNKTIVIIGGMGPQASLALHDRILKASRKHHSGLPNEYPQIIHLSLRIPNFASSKNEESRALKVINDGLQNININTNTLVCIPCNTAHKLVEKMNLPKKGFVSMIDAVKDDITNRKLKKVGLLASPNTIKSKLYEQQLIERGIECIKPDNTDIKILDEIILGVISGENPQQLRAKLTGIANRLIARGADSILLGCTELPIVGVEVDVPVVDSLDTLSNELMKELI